MGLVHIFPYMKTKKINHPCNDRTKATQPQHAFDTKNWPLKHSKQSGSTRHCSHLGLPKKKQGFLDGNPECQIKTCNPRNSCISKVFAKILTYILLMFGQSHESAPDLGDICSRQGLLHVQCWHVMVHMECQQSMLILAWFVNHRLTVNGSAYKLYLVSGTSAEFRMAGLTGDPLFKGSVGPLQPQPAALLCHQESQIFEGQLFRCPHEQVEQNIDAQAFNSRHS